MTVQFTSATIPLGFTVELIDCQRESGRPQPGAAGSSLVRVVDQQRDVDDQRWISRREPLAHKGFRFYPMRLEDSGHGKETVILRAVYDPARSLKKAGGLAICLGVAAMSFLRSYSRLSVDRG
jgi:hypothetical protein